MPLASGTSGSAIGHASSQSNPSAGGYTSSGVGSSGSGSGKHYSDKSDKLSAGIGSNQSGPISSLSSSSVGASSRATSLSPAAIPTTLIIKPTQDHLSAGSGKESLSKEAIAKFSSSNFTETIVVNSADGGVYGHGGSMGGSSTSSSSSVIESGKMNLGSGGASYSGSSSSTGASGSGGGNSGSSSGGGPGKKRKADARSTPTASTGSNEMDNNR